MERLRLTAEVCPEFFVAVWGKVGQNGGIVVVDGDISLITKTIADASPR
jgi:hypothetical protein